MSIEHLKAFFSEDNNKPIEPIKKRKQNEFKPILTASVERERQSIERYNEIGENIKKSERLRAELIKGATHEPIGELLLTALECISLMTGDKTWYKQNIEHLKGRL